VRDESGKDAAVRLVFEPRTSKIDRDAFVTLLLAHTSLETNVPANLVMIGRDGRPCCKPLAGILGEWIGFRVDTVRRRSHHRLARVEDRIHILEGRQAVLLEIDRVIRVIRNSDEPKPELMREFRLSERQAEDILEIRLRQLARLEGIRIEQELAQLRKDQAALGKLLGSEAALRRQVGREFDDDARKFGDARRTLIETARRAVAETRVLDEPVTVVLSEKGFARARSGHGHDVAQFGFKAGDALYGTYECRSVDHLIALGSNGRVYSVPVSALPSARGDGLPVSSFIDLEPATRLVGYVAGPASQPLLLATSGGTGFFCTIGDMVSRVRGGKQFITVDDGAVPLRPALAEAGEGRLACVSEKGRMLVFGAAEIKALSGGGRGVILMGLDDGEKLVAAVPCGEAGVIVDGQGRGGKAIEVHVRGRDLESHAGHRARKGTLITPRVKPVALRNPALQPAATG
jgi:topoisomerase-4 subunit A